MAVTAPANESGEQRFGRTALVLGAASIALFVTGFSFIPWGDYLGIAAAIAALVYGGLALRHHRAGDRAWAFVGVGLALLTILAFALVIVIFVFTPGD